MLFLKKFRIFAVSKMIVFLLPNWKKFTAQLGNRKTFPKVRKGSRFPKRGKARNRFIYLSSEWVNSVGFACFSATSFRRYFATRFIMGSLSASIPMSRQICPNNSVEFISLRRSESIINYQLSIINWITDSAGGPQCAWQCGGAAAGCGCSADSAMNTGYSRCNGRPDGWQERHGRS